ncbi:TPA: hypothetical protein NG611_004543 [Vibrio parahaemolyticus]|nr:hypothetical protein [Vibrio parahaemolyticus]HCE3433827.1 hypothetical protein [Vibrio parahaemolyticus]HCG7246696.1 hypothetical protein [Vibrio parahaemolyticus]
MMIDSVDFQSFIDSEALYFSKYGKGGVLVCVSDETTYKLASEFNSRDEYNSFIGKTFKKVSWVQISDESVIVVLELSASQTMKRIMPRSEVTVEVYGSQS